MAAGGIIPSVSLFKRSEGASTAPIRVVVAETVDIACTPTEVMTFLLDPASAVLIGPTTTRCFRAPDTPTRQVGEQHFVVHGNDDPVTVDVEQVEEIDFPRRVRTRNLTLAGDLQVVYTCDSRSEGATTYTQEVGITVPDGTQALIIEQLFREETVRSTRRIKELLEGG